MIRNVVGGELSEIGRWFEVRQQGTNAAVFEDQGCSSKSGPASSSSTIPITVNIRKAASWPFHVFDCHIRNHSPPTPRKATSHINKARFSAATATPLA